LSGFARGVLGGFGLNTVCHFLERSSRTIGYALLSLHLPYSCGYFLSLAAARCDFCVLIDITASVSTFLVGRSAHFLFHMACL